MNYIDEIATEIHEAAEGTRDVSADYMPLYRIYAVLLLAKGHDVTRRDVHEAWAAWQAGIDPNHRSLIPFHRLSEEVQQLDQPYVDAIHEAWDRLASSAFTCEDAFRKGFRTAHGLRS